MISSQENRVQYTGNGATTAFAFPGPVAEEGDLIVQSVTSGGTETTHTLTADYTLTGVGTADTVTVTFLAAPASGTVVTIYRHPDTTQLLDLTENSNFQQEAVEAALDKQTTLVAYLEDTISRCLRFKQTDVAVNPPEIPLSRDSTLLGFDSSGELYLYEIDPDALELIAPATVGTSLLEAYCVTPAKTAPGAYWYAVETSYSSSTYLVTWGGLTVGNLVDGCQLSFRAVTVCGAGPVSLNANNLSTKKILRMDGTNLVAGDIIPTVIVRVQYSTTADGGTGAWLLQNPTGNPVLRFATGVLNGGGAGTDIYVVTPTVSVKSLASIDGQVLAIKLDTDLPAVARIQYAGLTAKKLLHFNGTEMSAGLLSRNQVIAVVYDTTADGGSGAFLLIEGVTRPFLYGAASGSTSSEIRVSIAGHHSTAYVTGLPLLIKTDVDALSASPMTLKVTPEGSSALSPALAIVKRNGMKPDDYEWRLGDFILVAYNGTNFSLISHDGPVQTALSAVSASAYAANSYGSITLPRVPRSIRWVARCKTADGVYAVADEVDVSGIVGTGANQILFSPAVTHSAGTVTLYLGYRTSDPWQVYRKTDGALQTLDQAKWELKCYYQL